VQDDEKNNHLHPVTRHWKIAHQKLREVIKNVLKLNR